MSEPLIIIAGTQVAWASSHAPKAGASYQYILLSDDGKVVIDASVPGSVIEVLVASAVSKDYPPGQYKWVLLETVNTEKFQIDTGFIDIAPNPLTATTASVKSHNQKVLEAIEAKIEGRAKSDHESYAIDGRQLSRIPFRELVELRKQYKWKVHNEQVSKGLRAPKRGVRHQ